MSERIFGDDLAGLRPLEIAERQALHVPEDGVAQVARDVLLERRAELPGEPDEDVLDDDDHDDRDDHRRRATERVGRVEERADRRVLSSGSSQPAAESDVGCLNSVLRNGMSSVNDEHVERRGDDVARRRCPPSATSADGGTRAGADIGAASRRSAHVMVTAAA